MLPFRRCDASKSLPVFCAVEKTDKKRKHKPKAKKKKPFKFTEHKTAFKVSSPASCYASRSLNFGSSVNPSPAVSVLTVCARVLLAFFAHSCVDLVMACQVEEPNLGGSVRVDDRHDSSSDEKVPPGFLSTFVRGISLYAALHGGTYLANSMACAWSCPTEVVFCSVVDSG